MSDVLTKLKEPSGVYYRERFRMKHFGIKQKETGSIGL